MPSKQPAFKSIGVQPDDYDLIQQIADQLSVEKGMPVSLSRTVHFIAEFWQQHRADEKGKQ